MWNRILALLEQFVLHSRQLSEPDVPENIRFDVFSVLEPAFMRFWEKDDARASDTVFSVSFLTITGLGIVVTGFTLLFASWISTSAVLQLEGDGAGILRIAAFIPLFDALVLIPFARLRMQRRPRVFALMRLAAIVINDQLNR